MAKKMSFKARLKNWRVSLNLTQEELSIKCGLSSTTLSHYETGRREPTLTNLIKIKKGLRCSFNDLLDNVSTK